MLIDWHSISSDCRYIIAKDYPSFPEPCTEDGNLDYEVWREQNYDYYALFDIAAQLDHASTPENPHSLAIHGLSESKVDFNLFVAEENCLIWEEQAYNYTSEQVDQLWSSLNEDQHAAAEKIVDAVEDADNEFGSEALFF